MGDITTDTTTESKPRPKDGMKKNASDRIIGSNWCTMFLYNIPRASLMITLPGLVILICGAAMTAFIDSGQSWTDGLALIALVCLCVGGVLTLFGLVYWFFTWWRYKPAMPKPTNNAKQFLPDDGHEVVSLEAVYSYPPQDLAPTLPVSNGLSHEHHAAIDDKLSSTNADVKDVTCTAEVHAETVFTVP